MALEVGSLVSTKGKSNVKHGKIIRSIAKEGSKKPRWVVEFYNVNGVTVTEELTSSQLKKRAVGSTSPAPPAPIEPTVPRRNGAHLGRNATAPKRTIRGLEDSSDDEGEEDIDDRHDDMENIGETLDSMSLRYESSGEDEVIATNSGKIFLVTSISF